MKTALITGATSGFGEAMARRFVREGWHVIGTGRRSEKLEQLKHELGEAFQGLAFDITDEEHTQSAITSVLSDDQCIEVLINNAGLALGMDSVLEGDMSDWNTMIDTNIKGLLHMTKLIAPHMVKNKSGHIINLGSVAGNYPYPGANIYGGTKAFVNMFALELRADLHGTGVRVSSIEPGFCETEFGIVRFKGDVEKANNFYDGMNPITAEDIAETVYWCATQPKHVNINRIELMPTNQSFSGFSVHRE